MRRSLRPAQYGASLGLICLIAATPPGAQTQGPLSVIDWLGTQSTSEVARPAAKLQPKVEEPPVTQSAVAPVVAVHPLGQGGPREIGLVPARITGLPSDLWLGSDITKLTARIASLPDLHLPAAQSLLYTVLLAEAGAPSNFAAAGDTLALARVKALMKSGAIDPALSLIEQAGVSVSSAHFDLWMQNSLLVGTEDRACDTLAKAPHLTQDYGTRIFCNARARRWEDAALTLGSAQALGLMPKEKIALMARFLDPEAYENLPPLPLPRNMDPLTFRLFESIGERIPTNSLPRAYAVADLRDVAGWKAQLEAAERLTRAGALPDNQLLGLYSERKAAASGGIWDRVQAMQRFETALDTGSAEAVSKTLPELWQEMRSSELEIPFSALFADRLAGLNLTGGAAAIARTVLLLSPGYEVAAAEFGNTDLASQIASGELSEGRPADIVQGAIYDAFTGAPPRADLVAMVKQRRLGESILEVLILLHKGTRGNDKALTAALATLRALGLEDTARRAALQILLLER
ncbi:hypothetical protein OS190_10215 [Sulfitobacter sp. F26204]|uniref:hypothetical protein n=1 Tax=Sulfitobacter sp. F26204 TaxID=2996014 RepID=UPI00225DF493|nr:hypothetical protein [Sulfitobacter sp. F26204]MCX7559942.1 hypothetical protein [Sulfitobacter sp. F26204]